MTDSSSTGTKSQDWDRLMGLAWLQSATLSCSQGPACMGGSQTVNANVWTSVQGPVPYAQCAWPQPRVKQPCSFTAEAWLCLTVQAHQI